MSEQRNLSLTKYCKILKKHFKYIVSINHRENDKIQAKMNNQVTAQIGLSLVKLINFNEQDFRN